MDVRLMANLSYPASQVAGEAATPRPESEPPHLRVAHENVMREIREKTMMDLKDVQRFLYMMIGSKIKVESENSEMGGHLNSVA